MFENGFCFVYAVFCGCCDPAEGFVSVFFGAVAFKVHHACCVLGAGDAGFGGFFHVEEAVFLVLFFEAQEREGHEAFFVAHGNGFLI